MGYIEVLKNEIAEQESAIAGLKNGDFMMQGKLDVSGYWITEYERRIAFTNEMI